MRLKRVAAALSILNETLASLVQQLVAMTGFYTNSPSAHTMPHAFSNSSSDHHPNTFERVPNNQKHHSYNSTSLTSQRARMMARHEVPESFTASATSFEPVIDSPLGNSFSLSRFSTTPDVSSHPPAYRHDTPAMHTTTARFNGSPVAEARFRGLFSAHPNAEPISVTGTAIDLQKLGAAVQGGITVGPTDSLSAAAAFESSLLPIQAASILPTPEQIESLFRLPRPLQRASGLDVTTDFCIDDQDSARHIALAQAPPLLAYTEIDCARQYLEICSRHKDVGSVVEIGILTFHDSRFSFEVLPTVSRLRATNALFLFRQILPGFFSGYSETYRPFVSLNSAAAMPAEPSPGALQSIRLNSEMKAALAKALRIGLVNHGPEVNKMILKGHLDFIPPPRLSGTHQLNSSRKVQAEEGANIEGPLILQAAQRYTNTELHEQIKASGSEVSYNSVTKRITNALKARAKQALQPGEDINERYEALRKAFDRARTSNLKNLASGGSTMRGSSNGDGGGNNNKRSKLSTLSDGSEEEEATESDADGDEDMEMDQHAGGDITAVRRSARVRRSPTSQAPEEMKEEYTADEDEMEEESEPESEDSDGSEYGESD